MFNNQLFVLGEKMVRTLIQHGANVNAVNKNGAHVLPQLVSTGEPKIKYNFSKKIVSD